MYLLYMYQCKHQPEPRWSQFLPPYLCPRLPKPPSGTAWRQRKTTERSGFRASGHITKVKVFYMHVIGSLMLGTSMCVPMYLCLWTSWNIFCLYMCTSAYIYMCSFCLAKRMECVSLHYPLKQDYSNLVGLVFGSGFKGHCTVGACLAFHIRPE